MKYCGKCNKPINIIEKIVSENETERIHEVTEQCDNCKIIYKKYNKKVIKPKAARKDSALSIWAVVLSLFGITSFIAFILALVDLGINDKTKRHLGSWVALVFCVLYLFVGGGVILGSSGSSANDTASNNTQTSEIIVTTTPSETVVETPASEEVVIEYQQVEANLLLTTLEENALRAENTYQDAYLEITGELSVIDSDGKYIGIKRTDGEISFVNIQCYITEESQLDKVLEMNIGDTIIVKGQVTDIGEILGYMVDIHDLEIVTE